MRRSIVIAIALFGIVTVNSCKKNNKTSIAASDMLFIPLDMDSLMPGLATSAYYWGEPFPYVSGVLVACKITGAPIDTTGHIHTYIRNWEAALFSNTVSDSFINAGIVSVNAASLNSVLYNSYSQESYYLHYDTAITWNESGVNHWNVSGGSNIPAFAVDIDGSYPSFTGTLPDTISKTNDFSLTFNSSNTSNGDSAYVVIYFYGTPVHSKVVSANNGTVTIPASELTRATNGYINLPYIASSITDPLYFGGGYILVVIYNHSIQTFGGKRFAFVKQRVELGIVSFN